MRIAQLVSSLHSVFVGSTKAIYSHVGALTNTMVKDGHHVDLYASGDSVTNGTLRFVTEKALSCLALQTDIQNYYLHASISECYKNADQVDIVHSHFTLLSGFYASLGTVPTLISIHSPIRDEIRPILMRYRDLSYVSFSRAQRLQMPELNWVANVYHGVDTNLFAYNAVPKDYVLYLGRVTEEKGVHIAIQAAKAAGVKLLIAGGSYGVEGYWQKSIEPFIDGVDVRYMGVADETQKIELLQNARALVFPTQYDEVFGLVMIEAMSCGTPVIAWKSGSVPEVVSHGRTGFIVDSVEGMTEAIHSVDKISREETRHRAVSFFSEEKMTLGYLRVYERVIEEFKKEKSTSI